MLHLGPIWYHSEPSDVPYSQNLPRPISWIGLFLQLYDSNYISSSQIHKKLSKRNISAEKRVLYGKLGQYQKIREITAGHLYQGLGQSPQSFLMFAKGSFSGTSNFL